MTSAYITHGGTVFGDASIFGYHGYEWAAKINDANGSFKIGVWLKGHGAGGALKFSWMVGANPIGDCEPRAPLVVVSPSFVRILFRQSVQFRAAVQGLPQSNIIWSVREQDGGTITKDRYYVAPAIAGVFAVCATSASSPDVEGIGPCHCKTTMRRRK